MGGKLGQQSIINRVQRGRKKACAIAESMDLVLKGEEKRIRGVQMLIQANGSVKETREQQSIKQQKSAREERRLMQRLNGAYLKGRRKEADRCLDANIVQWRRETDNGSTKH